MIRIHKKAKRFRMKKRKRTKMSKMQRMLEIMKEKMDNKKKMKII